MSRGSISFGLDKAGAYPAWRSEDVQGCTKQRHGTCRLRGRPAENFASVVVRGTRERYLHNSKTDEQA
jgi:hypothetical protein